MRGDSDAEADDDDDDADNEADDDDDDDADDDGDVDDGSESTLWPSWSRRESIFGSLGCILSRVGALVGRLGNLKPRRCCEQVVLLRTSRAKRQF